MIRKLAPACAAAGLAVTAGLVGTGEARTQGGQPWVVNGSVTALAVSGHTLYLGGGFTQVSPRSGPLVAFSASGARLGFPVVEGGTVHAVVGDGKGGWFVGGDFTRIGGIACANLAHLTATFAVEPRFCPRPDDEVLSLAVDGPVLYVGGSFRRIGSTGRSNLAALDATGRVTSWKPDIDGYVSEMTIRNGVLYLVGGFGAVGGKVRVTLGAVDERTGEVTDWDPKAEQDEHGDPTVTTIAAGPSAIYVGGSFDRIGGQRRRALAALDPVNGKATSWAPKGLFAVETLTAAGHRLYVGAWRTLAAYNLTSGTRASWSPTVGPGIVTAIGVGGGRVYVSDSRLEAFDVATGRREAWYPTTPNGAVAAIVATAHAVVAGGTFDGTGGVARDGLAALDLRTGRPTAWYPHVASSENGPEIDAIAPSGRVVYLAGLFDHLGGKPRHLVGAVDATTGRATSWAPAVQGDQMLALAVSGSKVYVGGFGTGSQFDTSGGLGWNAPPETGSTSSVNAILVAQGAAYFGGWFDIVGGKSRLGLAALDPHNGAAAAWNPRLADTDAEPQVQALALSGSTLLVGGSFVSAGGAKRADLASFDLATGQLTSWAPKIDLLSVYSLAATPRLVYVGGDGGIVAVNARTGAQLGWHPVLTQGTIGFTLVHAIAVVGSTVYVGGDGGLDVFPAPRG
jgi:trimeric autotransporter adhesin